MLQVLNKNKTADKFDAKAEEEQLSQNNLRVAASSLIQTLYLQAKVVDRRYKFF